MVCVFTEPDRAVILSRDYAKTYCDVGFVVAENLCCAMAHGVAFLSLMPKKDDPILSCWVHV